MANGEWYLQLFLQLIIQPVQLAPQLQRLEPRVILAAGVLDVVLRRCNHLCDLGAEALQPGRSAVVSPTRTTHARTHARQHVSTSSTNAGAAAGAWEPSSRGC